MRVTSFAKAGIGLTAFALLTGALAATPALADPTNTTDRGTLVGVGSDTTQDVMNGIATAVGGVSGNPRIASYNAFTYGVNNSLVIGGTITTRTNGTAFARPDGSGDGLSALEVAIGNKASATGTGTVGGQPWNTANTLGQVDFARSSSGPAAVISGGVVTYIPFARDAVDYALAPDNDFPELSVGSASDSVDDNQFLEDGTTPNPDFGVGASSLYSIYHGLVTEIATGGAGDPKLVNRSYVALDGETIVPIHAYVPQAGSGTRKFWVAQLGLTDGNTDTGGVFFDTQVTGGITGAPTEAIVGTGTSQNPQVTDPASVSQLNVQEHDGTVLSPLPINSISNGVVTFGATGVSDPGAIAPFSIAKWAADDNLGGTPSTGVVDARHGAVLGSILYNDGASSVDPTIGSEGSFGLNPDYVTDASQLQRLVYNIVPTAQVAEANSLTNWAFVGTGSLVCSQKDTIKEYGFGVLTDTSGASACGDTSRTAIAPDNSSTVILSKPSKTSGSYGTTFTDKATVTSTGNGGGTVTFQAQQVVSSVPTGAVYTVGTATIPVGSTVTPTTTLSAVGPVAGTWALTATFSPNLEGLGLATSSNPETIKTSAVTPTLKGSITSVSHTVVPVLKVTVSAKGFIPSGTVTIKSGSTVIATADIDASGKATINLPLAAKGTHTIKVTYNGDHGAKATSVSVSEKLK